LLKNIFLYILLVLFNFCAGADDFAGVVKKLRGSVYKLVPTTGEQEFLAKDSKIKSGDLIITSSRSFVKIEMSDETSISIAQNSSFKIKQFIHDQTQRKSLFNLVHGKYRAKIKRKVRDGEVVEFGNRTVSVGVRGTEFLSNAYIVKNAPVSDVALLEGSLEANVKGLSNSIPMKPSNALNTSALKQGGSLTKLSDTNVSSILSKPDYMLPNMQNADGSFIDLNKAVQSELTPKKIEKTSTSESNSPSLKTPSLPSIPVVPAMGVGLGVSLGGGSSVADKIVNKDEKVEEKKSSVKIVETVDDLKNEPWDIKDALIRGKELKKQNICFFWIYKTLPGRGEPERFRRERECDEFRNDL